MYGRGHFFFFFFFSSRRRHTRWNCDWSSDVCSSDLPGQLPDLLERQRRTAGRARQNHPVLSSRIWLAGSGRLIARAIPQAEQLPVELGQAPRVGGVQDRLPDDRERLLVVHAVTIGAGYV